MCPGSPSSQGWRYCDERWRNESTRCCGDAVEGLCSNLEEGSSLISEICEEEGFRIMPRIDRLPQRLFWLVILGVVFQLRLGLAAEVVEHPGQGLKLAAFDVDATPTVGFRMAYGPVIRSADLPLRCRGIVLLGAEAPIVLCAVDWIGIGNAAHDVFREELARAAGTSADRVAVHALHQHDAPHADFTAEEIIKELGVEGVHRFDGAFPRQVLAAAVAAIRQALPNARPVTHVGFGEHAVAEIASNRRLLGPDGKVRAWRGSTTRDPALRAEPEGLIDPLVSTLAFWSDAEPIAVLTSYATHPMSYYRTGVPSPDFPGIARFLRSQDVPTAMHVHFTGAAGNIAAGKYNDGSRANRVLFATRMATAMRLAFTAAETARRALTAADVGFESFPVVLKPRRELDRNALLAAVRQGGDRGTFDDIDALAWLDRAAEKQPIIVSCLRVGDVRMLHLPGELFIEYQLAARQMRPDLNVMLAAYGNYGTGYIGTAHAYNEGGYETKVGSSFVGPEAEEELLAAMRNLLEVAP